MEELTAVLNIDMKSLIVNIFLVLLTFVFVVNISSKVWEILKSPINWFKSNNKDHELLKETIRSVDLLRLCIEDSMELIGENRKNIQEFYEKAQEDKENFLLLKEEIEKRNEQLDKLTIANKELLAQMIDQRYVRYKKLNGIPEEEYEDFLTLHSSYNLLGGNSSRDAKFEYCINHLPIIQLNKNKED